jgi:hypothetical protein
MPNSILPSSPIAVDGLPTPIPELLKLHREGPHEAPEDYDVANEITHSIMFIHDEETIPTGLLTASDWHLKDRLPHLPTMRSRAPAESSPPTEKGEQRRERRQPRRLRSARLIGVRQLLFIQLPHPVLRLAAGLLEPVEHLSGRPGTRVRGVFADPRDKPGDLENLAEGG